MLDEISILKNTIQNYPWGSKTAISQLLDIPNPESKPMAELWMGAHPKAPSRVLINGQWISLLEVINSDPESILGQKVAKKFNNELPFLFKVLAAEIPLSIQVHPNKEQAEEGFERENRQGIPLSAPNRNYKDPNHKPELLCALTPFEALKGFRPIDEIISFFRSIGDSALSILLQKLCLPDKGLNEFFRFLMWLDHSEKPQILKPILRHAEKNQDKEKEWFWVLELNKYFPGDIGIISPLILNLVSLKPGEAIFLPARELHAYLKGTGLEIMANSDNVLRGGLTSKYMDVEELLKIVRFEGYRPEIIKAKQMSDNFDVYHAPVEEFELSRIVLTQGFDLKMPESHGIEILICIEGAAEISEKSKPHSLKIKKGDSVVVPGNCGAYGIRGEAVLYRASVPSS